MNLSELLQSYKDDPRIKTMVDAFSTQIDVHLEVQGCIGSIDAFLAAALSLQTQRPMLCLLRDREEAAYFHQTLSDLLHPKEIQWFCDSYKKPRQFDQQHNPHILLRTEAVNQYTESGLRSPMMVTYPEALIEPVVTREQLKASQLLIHIGEKLDSDFMIDLLIHYGFERVDQVYEPGQFAIRGDITDIFSFGNDQPYRIELFGNEVESIRTFDPETQRSLKRISRISIIPNVQEQLGAETKVPLGEILSPETIFWVRDPDFVLDVWMQCFEKLETSHPSSESSQPHWVKPAYWISCWQRFALVRCHPSLHLPKALIQINAHIRPQPSFNKNFKLLMNNLEQLHQGGITPFLFADNPKQIERFYHIFEDLEAEWVWHPIPRAIHEGFIDDDLKIACYTDHQIFERYHKYRLKEGQPGHKTALLKALKELHPGDFVTHVDYGIGVFSGLEKIEVNGQWQEAVRIVYRDNDLLYVNIHSLHKISKYSGKEGTTPKLNKLGTDAWETLKKRTKRKIQDIAEELIKLYAKRKSSKGFAFHPDTYLQNELEASFMYEDTPDQEKATLDFKRDMEAGFPMDRLVCGDVGFGKTEIAIRAAFKAVADSKQVAVLVPTTILSMQHFRTFSKRLKELPCNLDYINRFKSGAQKKETLQKVQAGQVDILIGTHAILSNQVKFKDLGLLVIDEEQKFGVAAKEKLRSLKANVDTLTLTATPIPRTLQFSLMGARDLSVIQTPPPNRQPIQTEVRVFQEDLIKEAIEFEVFRGGQVYFVHNRVKDIQEIAALVQNLCPEVRIRVAHGQMEGGALEEAMMAFMNYDADVLVCTNIVESGLDVPNANTMIIHNAHHFGLSDLHQLRGRVGRSNRKAFCYLLAPPMSVLPTESRKRLSTLEEFSDLGSGFQIAMRDMDIRGAGNLLGAEQSGFIAEIGYDMYHKILDEAIRELKEGEYYELYKDELPPERDFVRDCQIETDLEMLIPDSYIRNIQERLQIYTELDHIRDEEGLQDYKEGLRDRFGKIPPQVEELLNGLRLRWRAKKLGFERIHFKQKKLKCYFVENPESAFYHSPVFDQVITFVQQHPKICHMKQTDKYLILTVEPVHNMKEASSFLQEVEQYVQKHMQQTSTS